MTQIELMIKWLEKHPDDSPKRKEMWKKVKTKYGKKLKNEVLK